MKIYLRDIPYDGLVVKRVIKADEIGLADENFVCRDPLNIEARVEKVDAQILAKVEVKGAFEFACARCLEPIRQERIENFDLNYEVVPRMEFIELGEDIRQEMVVALSKVFLCREDCKGLCPTCGASLNQGECRCRNKS